MGKLKLALEQEHEPLLIFFAPAGTATTGCSVWSDVMPNALSLFILAITPSIHCGGPKSCLSHLLLEEA